MRCRTTPACGTSWCGTSRRRPTRPTGTRGRPGPVLIDVPKDVQNQKIEYGPPRTRARGQSRPQTPGASPGLEDGVRKAARLIAGAERPLLMVGHGVILAQAYVEVRALAEKTGIPVITTLLGISAF